MTKFQNIINWVEEIREKNHSSGAALYIMKDNEVLLEHYSGKHSNTKDALQITKTSQFNVASARKSFKRV